MRLPECTEKRQHFTTNNLSCVYGHIPHILEPSFLQLQTGPFPEHFTSEPYADEDWSGQSRKTFYMDMDFDTVINPTSAGILSTAALAAAIPEIDSHFF